MENKPLGVIAAEQGKNIPTKNLFKKQFNPEEIREAARKIGEYMRETGHNIVLELLGKDKIRFDAQSCIIEIFMDHIPENMRHQQDDDGNTILHYAMMQPLHVLDIVLAGGDLTIKNNEGLNPIEFGIKYAPKFYSVKDFYQNALRYIYAIKSEKNEIDTFDIFKNIIEFNKVWLFNYIFKELNFEQITKKYENDFIFWVNSSEMMEELINKGLTSETQISTNIFELTDCFNQIYEKNPDIQERDNISFEGCINILKEINPEDCPLIQSKVYEILKSSPGLSM